jgi:hypothetical protein
VSGSYDFTAKPCLLKDFGSRVRKFLGHRVALLGRIVHIVLMHCPLPESNSKA